MRIWGTISIHDTTLCYFNPVKQSFQLKQKLVISSWLAGQEALRIYLSLPPVLQQLELYAAIFSLFYKCRGIRTWVWMLAQCHCWLRWGFVVVAGFGQLDTSLYHLGRKNIIENIPYPKLLLVVVFLVAKEN